MHKGLRFLQSFLFYVVSSSLFFNPLFSAREVYVANQSPPAAFPDGSSNLPFESISQAFSSVNSSEPLTLFLISSESDTQFIVNSTLYINFDVTFSSPERMSIVKFQKNGGITIEGNTSVKFEDINFQFESENEREIPVFALNEKSSAFFKVKPVDFID